jgi:hypothetical protein
MLTWDEYTAYSYNIQYWLTGLIAPATEMKYRLFGEQQYISHIGYLTLVFIPIALAKIMKNDNGRVIVVFTILAFFSLLWASDIVITKIFYQIPVFNRFKVPFKVAYFTSFFLIIVSTFGFDWSNRKLTGFNKNGRYFTVAASILLLTLHAANFLFLYTILPQRKFASHSDTVPFVEPLSTSLKAGRIVSASHDVVWDGEVAVTGFTLPLLGYNYATLLDLYHFGGYDDLVSDRNLQATLGSKNSSAFNVAPGTTLNIKQEVPLDYFRIWGVRWYVFDAGIPVSNTDNLRLFHSDSHRNIWQDSSALPFVYWADAHNDDGIFFKFRSNSLEVKSTRNSEGTLAINVLYNPLFKAAIDGRDALIGENSASQMLIKLPAGEHVITLTYSDTYFMYGSLISLCSMIFITAVFFLKKFRKQAADHNQSYTSNGHAT